MCPCQKGQGTGRCCLSNYVPRRQEAYVKENGTEAPGILLAVGGNECLISGRSTNWSQSWSERDGCRKECKIGVLNFPGKAHLHVVSN